jgi:hypothetical protein
MYSVTISIFSLNLHIPGSTIPIHRGKLHIADWCCKDQRSNYYIIVNFQPIRLIRLVEIEIRETAEQGAKMVNAVFFSFSGPRLCSVIHVGI